MAEEPRAVVAFHFRVSLRIVGIGVSELFEREMTRCRIKMAEKFVATFASDSTNLEKRTDGVWLSLLGMLLAIT